MSKESKEILIIDGSLEKSKANKNAQGKIIVFYTGYSPSFNPKDPDNNSVECYGSELCTRNIAEQLAKYNYDVHIFSSGNSVISTHYGVTYHNTFTYAKFQHDNIIDILIISRYINFFIYNVPIAKRVIFWSHDITVQPSFNGLSLHDNGAQFTLNILHHIDNYVALTPTHREFIINNYLGKIRYLSEEEQKKIVVVGNGLVPEYFTDQSKITKIKKSIYLLL